MSYQPYQSAGQVVKRKSEDPGNFAKGILDVGTSYAGGLASAKVASRLLPFLNEFISPDIFKKGVSKVSPFLGKFINKAEDYGYQTDDLKTYLKDNIQKNQKNNNIIKQYSPSLHSFLEETISKGIRPLDAAVQAQNNPSFIKDISNLSKDYRKKWLEIVKEIYGVENQGLQSPIPQRGEPYESNEPSVMRIPSQQQNMMNPMEQTQQTPQQGQGSQGDQAIIAALQKILSM